MNEFILFFFQYWPNLQYFLHFQVGDRSSACRGNGGIAAPCAQYVCGEEGG